MSPEATYACPTCGMKFPSEADLRQHSAAHMSPAPAPAALACPACGGTFSTKAELEDHAARAQGVPALCLLAESRTDLPDARGAARLLERLHPFVPLVPIDERPLYEQALAFETEFRKQVERSKQVANDLSKRADLMYG